MGFNFAQGGFVMGAAFLLVVALIVVTGHCTFNGSVGLGLH
jgi:hypothetical protein